MKNAIVTGATRGIGLATAEMLLQEGYHVTVTYAYDEDSVQPCKAMLLRSCGWTRPASRRCMISP